MITNTGRTILAKYIIGQAPEYASYMAFGCGPKPRKSISYNISNKLISSGTATLTTSADHEFVVDDYVLVKNVDANLDGTYQITAVTSNTFSFHTTLANVSSTAVSPVGKAVISFSHKESLDFEIFRQPIVSRGYVVENGVAKVVLTAELPSDAERYEITEVGLYSAGKNPSAAQNDSRNLMLFSNSENWVQYANNNGATGTAISEITEILDSGSNDNTLIGGTVATPVDHPTIFRTNSSNLGLDSNERNKRFERCRFLKTTLFVRGDTTNFTSFTPSTSSAHIGIESLPIDLGKNSPSDEVRLAFSVVTIGGVGTTSVPDSVKIVVRFMVNSTTYTDMRVEVPGSDLISNRYVVATKKISELVSAGAFSWSQVVGVKVFASAIVTGTPSEDYFICLDALRLENTTVTNPLYGLTGYSVISNYDQALEVAQPIYKKPSTSNFVEFRFSLDVK